MGAYTTATRRFLQFWASFTGGRTLQKPSYLPEDAWSDTTSAAFISWICVHEGLTAGTAKAMGIRSVLGTQLGRPMCKWGGSMAEAAFEGADRVFHFRRREPTLPTTVSLARAFVRFVRSELCQWGPLLKCSVICASVWAFTAGHRGEELCGNQGDRDAGNFTYRGIRLFSGESIDPTTGAREDTASASGPIRQSSVRQSQGGGPRTPQSPHFEHGVPSDSFGAYSDGRFDRGSGESTRAGSADPGFPQTRVATKFLSALPFKCIDIYFHFRPTQHLHPSTPQLHSHFYSSTIYSTITQHHYRTTVNYQQLLPSQTFGFKVLEGARAPAGTGDLV